MESRERRRVVRVSRDMCIRSGCQCNGSVCVWEPDEYGMVPCPIQSGCIEEAVEARLRQCGLFGERYDLREEWVIANPEDWPRLYSGDGQHYVPLNPRWERCTVRYTRRYTLDEACEALRDYERRRRRQPPQEDASARP